MAKNGNGTGGADGGTALAERPETSGAIVASGGGARLAGAEQSDFVLPRVHIFQGLPAETKLYPGKFKKGDFVNSLSFEKLESKKFVPLFGWKEWILWREPRGNGIDYRTRDKGAVPASDLLWDREKGTPPKVTEYINFAVIFESETAPVVLSFCKTMIKAGQTLHTLESMRKNKGPGFYSMDTRDKSNAKGDWLIPLIRPLGDPEAELAELAAALRDGMDGSKVDTNIDESGTDDAPDGE